MFEFAAKVSVISSSVFEAVQLLFKNLNSINRPVLGVYWSFNKRQEDEMGFQKSMKEIHDILLEKLMKSLNHKPMTTDISRTITILAKLCLLPYECRFNDRSMCWLNEKDMNQSQMLKVFEIGATDIFEFADVHLMQQLHNLIYYTKAEYAAYYEDFQKMFKYDTNAQYTPSFFIEFISTCAFI